MPPPTPFDLAQKLLCLGGESLDLASYPYLRSIYNSRASRIMLATARQVSKCGWAKNLVYGSDGRTRPLGSVRVGDLVLSVDPDTLACAPSLVTMFWDSGLKPAFRVTTARGASAVWTAEHRVLSIAGFVPVSELRPGSTIAYVYRGLNHPGDTVWDHVASIEPVGEVETCDLEVEGTHTYVSDGMVVHNSTTIASKLVLNAVLHPGSVQVFYAPLQEQAMVFAQQRLREFITGSPIVRDGFFEGPGKIDQVLRRVFSTGNSMITLGYAQRTADRLRGQSVKDGHMITYRDPKTGEPIEVGGALIAADELQDIYPDVFSVVEEMALRAKAPRFWYCGTPKSMNNPMEDRRRRATGAEWAVQCQATGCKKYNLNWNEKNIGDAGVICEFCGAPLNTDLNATWVPARHLDLDKGKNAKTTIESYRIPQLIVRPIMSRKTKWLELLEKQRTYSTERFRNEVLGLPHDGGSQPITYAELAACCDNSRPNVVPDHTRQVYCNLVMGVDWAFQAENSFTFTIIGCWNPFPAKFEVHHWKIFKGVESDSQYQIDWITSTAGKCNIQLLGCDWGAGHVQNIQLSNALGSDRVVQLWHTGLGGAGGNGPRVKWFPAGHRYHLSRTRVLTDTFETIRQRRISFPREEDCKELFDNFMAMSLEYNERTNRQHYVNIEPDDGVHATTYGLLAGEFLQMGNFEGHGNTEVASTGAMADRWEEAPDPQVDSFYS